MTIHQATAAAGPPWQQIAVAGKASALKRRHLRILASIRRLHDSLDVPADILAADAVPILRQH